MSDSRLDAHYRRYVAHLNARRLDEAEAFHADELLYNGERIGRAEWCRSAIDAGIEAMPDLRWNIEHLVITGGDVAARLATRAPCGKPGGGSSRPAEWPASESMSSTISATMGGRAKSGRSSTSEH